MGEARQNCLTMKIVNRKKNCGLLCVIKAKFTKEKRSCKNFWHNNQVNLK